MEEHTHARTSTQMCTHKCAHKCAHTNAHKLARTHTHRCRLVRRCPIGGVAGGILFRLGGLKRIINATNDWIIATTTVDPRRRDFVGFMREGRRQTPAENASAFLPPTGVPREYPFECPVSTRYGTQRYHRSTLAIRAPLLRARSTPEGTPSTAGKSTPRVPLGSAPSTPSSPPGEYSEYPLGSPWGVLRVPPRA